MNESRRPVYVGRRLLCNVLKVYKSVLGGAVPRAFFRRREGQFRRRVTGFQRRNSSDGFFRGVRNGFKGAVPLSGGAFLRADFSEAHGTVSKAQSCFPEARFPGRIFRRRTGRFRRRSSAFRRRVSPDGFFGGARNGFKGAVPLCGGAFPRADFSEAHGTV